MFNKTIANIGAKGGVGKTTTSHMLAHGFSRFGIAAVLVTTDHNDGRTSLSDTARSYQTIAGQDGSTLDSIFKTFSNLEIDADTPRVMIVDGGGNRLDMDNLLYQASDITLLPFRDSHEDLRVVSTDLDRYPAAFGLPSMWPSNVFAQSQLNSVFLGMQERYPDRILKPVPAIRSSQNLLRDEPGEIDSKLNSVCKALAVEVLGKLGINAYKIHS